METLANSRYCAKGDQCAEFPVLGAPTRLGQYNPEEICESCRTKLGELPPRVSEAAAVHAKPQFAESGLARALRTQREELLLQILKKRGPFWGAVRDMRERWGLQPATQLPPNPSTCAIWSQCGPEGVRNVPGSVVDERLFEDWNNDLNTLLCVWVPERFRRLDILPKPLDFVAACVLFDPPVPGLVEFNSALLPRATAIMGPTPGTLADKFRNEEESLQWMVLPPIRQIRDPRVDRDIEARHWIDVLMTVWELYIEPQELDFKQMLKTVYESENFRQRVDEWNRNKPADTGPRYFVEVDEFTTEDDVRVAFGMLSKAQEERPRQGRSARNRLVCAEAAELHDGHGWSYDRLAVRYGWDDPNRASKFIKDGRELLNTW